MATKRAKRMLLSVAAVSLGVVEPMACSSTGFIGDVAVPPDAAAARSDSSDASPDAPDVGAVGKVPFDSGKD